MYILFLSGRVGGINEIDIGNFSVIVRSIIENLVVIVVFNSILVGVVLLLEVGVV